jgi:hypothetical protein
MVCMYVQPGDDAGCVSGGIHLYPGNGDTLVASHGRLPPR